MTASMAHFGLLEVVDAPLVAFHHPKPDHSIVEGYSNHVCQGQNMLSC
jgi:hypothetical protein